MIFAILNFRHREKWRNQLILKKMILVPADIPVDNRTVSGRLFDKSLYTSHLFCSVCGILLYTSRRTQDCTPVHKQLLKMFCF